MASSGLGQEIMPATTTPTSTAEATAGTAAAAAAAASPANRRDETTGPATPLKSNRRANNGSGRNDVRDACDQTTKPKEGRAADGVGNNVHNDGKLHHRKIGKKRRRRQVKRGSTASSVSRHKSGLGRVIRCASIHPDATHQDDAVDAIATASDRIGTSASASEHSHQLSATAEPRPTPPIHLPHNQYEVIIRRRAIIREEDVQNRVEELAQQAQQQQQKERDVEDGKRRIVLGTEHQYGWPRGNPEGNAAESTAESIDQSPTAAAHQRPTIDEARRRKLPGMPSLREIDNHTTASSNGNQKQEQIQSTKKPTVTMVSENEELKEGSPDDDVGNVNTVDGDDDEAVEEEHDDDLAGDTSLGLKLTILGGHVIVQGLNSLADGRASPAQLTGLVRRGDVLVAIDGRSLVHLPLDRLSEALKPLSEAESGTFVPPVGVGSGGRGVDNSSVDNIPPGVPYYRRTLRLRFSMGEGLPFLNRPRRRRRPAPSAPAADSTASNTADENSGERPKEEQQQAAALAAEDIAADVLGLTQFLMVDQLSGLPMFGDDYHKQATATEAPVEEKVVGSGESISSETIASTADVTTANIPSSISGDEAAMALQSSAIAVKMLGLSATSAARLSRQIAYQIAQERKDERARSISLFFELNRRGSALLRGSDAFDIAEKSTDGQPLLSYGEMLELGRKAVLGADSLVNGAMEADLAASVEKQRKLDALDEEMSNDDASVEANMDVNSSSGMLGSVGAGRDANDSDFRGQGSQSLMRLAARDEMWRKELMTKLQDAIAIEGGDDEPEDTSGDNAQQEDKQNGIESQLQNLFWGDKVTTLIQKTRQRPLALPPKDIATTLFDLTTGIAMISDDISHRMVMSGRLLQDHRMATQFVLNEALPALLKTFHPLPWQQRRILWPLNSSAGSDVDSRLTDGDMTFSVASTSTGWGTPGQRKNLEEQIEDLELDLEVRAETCYLVTFYFIRYLLASPAIATNAEGKESSIDSWTEASKSTATAEEEKVVDFIKKYGAYLKLHTCIVRASEAGSGPILRALLDMARFDLRHRDCLKRLANKQTTFFLYESAMLSAILVRLKQINNDENASEDLCRIVPLLVSAYPDLKPKVVRGALLGATSTSSPPDADLHQRRTSYYRYLSLLLDADEGVDSARSEGRLVEEWCNLSVELYQESIGNSTPGASAMKSESFLNNFRSVASRASSRVDDSTHSFRNLPMLMNLSMQIKDYKLAIQLAGEIISTNTYSRDSIVITTVVTHIREILASEISHLNPSERYSERNLVQALIRLLNSISTSRSPDCQNAISVPDEFVKMLDLCSGGPEEPTSEKEKLLLAILVETAMPSDTLAALSLWNKCDKAPSVVIPALRSSLTLSALQEKERIQLLRIRRGREGMTSDQSVRPKASDGTIWEQALKGEVAIDK